ncbi:amidohydrolase family protein [Microbacterium sp. BG28]|uniref:amidohydrolase family protein n=1 Tax=Microbacterium sp. BG28 TaxID=3097356 RepID=UPI002A5A6E7B|nr:amidohydrolase family protein [Microbacterium sp. BG28]MDY0830178.1 amidohydrolase family protein [Microbacterium sp. BG28]
MSAVDTVIDDALIVTMDGARRVLRGWIAIHDGVVDAVGTGPAPAARERINARGGIVHPGFVSAHTHSMDAAAAGSLDESVPFFDWLFGTYYRTVLALTPADAARAVRSLAMDAARAGITTVLDCWGVGDVGTRRTDEAFAASAAAARASGIRWILAPMVSDRIPAQWSPWLDAAEHAGGFRREALVAPIETALRFAASALRAAAGRVSVFACTELPEMASDALLVGLGALDAPGITTHLCASDAGAAGIGGPDGGAERAVARLERLGVLSPRLVGAHLSATDADDRRRLASHGCGGVHCAASSMYAGSGRSALGELRESGIGIGLGLDNRSLNTPADMIAEMRHALAFDRAAGTGTERVTVSDLLAHATIDAARVLGMAGVIGSLEPGKRADLVVRSASGGPEMSAEARIVLASRADDVQLVLVDGEAVFAR